MRIVLSLVFLLTFFAASAQTGSVKGFVYEKDGGEVVIGATVGLKGTNKGSKTDVNGFFNIPKLVVGDYTLVVTYIGFETVEKEIKIEDGEILSLKIVLPKKSKDLKQTTVTAKREEKIYETKVGLTRITPKELKILPSVGGEPDIAQFLQVMPGVVSTGDQGGQLYIRGGSMIQNKILLDGMTIYNPFHSIGLYSVFETDAIRNADVHSGGFGAEYGDRTSAIVSVNTKDGNKQHNGGKVSINPILAKVFLEGPLVRDRGDSGTTVTYLASIKHSYLQTSASALYGFMGEPYATQLPYTFTDIYGKVSVNSSNGGKLSVFGFNFNDKVNFKNISNLNWNSYGIGANFLITPVGSSALINGMVNYSDYRIGLTESDNLPRTSDINGFNASVRVTSYLPNHSEMNYGLEFTGFKTGFNYYNFVGIKIQQDDYTSQVGGFFKLKKSISDKLVIEPGVRIQYYASVNAQRLEPRVALKYNLTEKFRLKASSGLYSQNLISSKSDKDIVNFFTAFVTAPDRTIVKPNGEEANNNIQKSFHLVGGLEMDIKDFEITIEPWYKYFTQLITINRYKLLPNDPDFSIETGKAYGTDFTLKYSKGRKYLWCVYSYGYVDRNDGRQTYPTPFDRRHNVNILASYVARKKQDIEFSARFNYGSAFPFTQTQAFVEQMNFTGGISTDYLNQNGNLGIIYANDINGGRLAAYHRLDLSAKKKFDITKFQKLEISAGVSNVYNQQNIFYIDRIRNTRTYQLPIFPSLGVNWNF